jgi:hypothetical protein
MSAAKVHFRKTKRPLPQFHAGAHPDLLLPSTTPIGVVAAQFDVLLSFGVASRPEGSARRPAKPSCDRVAHLGPRINDIRDAAVEDGPVPARRSRCERMIV